MRITLALLAGVAACASQAREQTERAVASGAAPSPRLYAQMAYDTRRHRVWLYGGRDSAGMRDDLWEWDGARWVDHGPQAPGARGCHAMAYDAHRDRLVLFGGGAGDDYTSDTWEYGDGRWVRRDAAGPAPRGCLGMAYDERRRVMVVYGGSSGFRRPDLDDTWEWDGTAWRQAATGSGPPGRLFHTLGYDARRGRTLLFGGRGGNGELWAWDGRAWARLTADGGPPPRDHHAMAYDRRRDRLVVFGGGVQRDGVPAEQAVLGDTWEFDGQRWTRADSGSTPGRFGMPALAYDAARGVTVMFGGSRPGRSMPDTWTWDGLTWRRVHGGR